MMKILNLLLVVGLFLLPTIIHAQTSDQEIDAVLTSAEGLFKAMQLNDYPGIWACITTKSRDTIVENVCRSIKAEPSAKHSLADDFSQGGTLSRAYWDAYLKRFDPVMVLDESKWEVGFIKGDHAEIVINYKKSPKPATVILTREDGSWRVGLVESFWSRK